jgi:hypothetical protein
MGGQAWEDTMGHEFEERPRLSGRADHYIAPQLIMKLRWIGLDDEANKLEVAILDLPADQRGSVSCGPFSTD